jgi:stage II sporulation protein P
MQMKNRGKIAIILGVLLLLIPQKAAADDWFEAEPGYFTVYEENGKELFVIGSEVSVDDEYVSEKNKRYRIVRVEKDKKRAEARFVENVVLPDITDEEVSMMAAALEDKQNKVIGIYNTHSDESYVPSDGKASIKGNGGIFDVSAQLGKELKKRGVKVVVDKTPHDPHDAGAYRRSRKTAVNLLKENQPAALFDVHRDAVPKEAYIKELKGEPISRVRIVIGRRNQNWKSNEALAYRIKAVADKIHPGLIKDIYYGKGNYNQELLPRSLLFEFGTYSHTKERALRSTSYLADVIVKTLYGGTAKAAEPNESTQVKKDVKVKPMDNESTGSKSGIYWMIAVLLIGGIGFLLISTGGKEIWSKVSKTGQEFSSFLGRQNKRKKD